MHRHSDYLMCVVISAPVLHGCAKPHLSYEDVVLIVHVLWSFILLYLPNPPLSLSVSAAL